MADLAIDGAAAGEQVITNEDGFKYTGELRGSKRHGRGTLTWPDGTEYVGQFWDGKRHGKGCCTWADGQTYDGEWAAGVREGYGKSTGAGGVTYVGQYVAGQRHGRGESHNPQDDSRYNGDWVEGKRQGYGVLTKGDGSSYEGEWVEGQMAGKGRYKWPSGQVYEGDWSANQRHGYGRTTHANGVMTEGDWIEGVLSGKGKLVDPSGLHQFEVRPARIFFGSVARCAVAFPRKGNVAKPRMGRPIIADLIAKSIARTGAMKRLPATRVHTRTPHTRACNPALRIAIAARRIGRTERGCGVSGGVCRREDAGHCEIHTGAAGDGRPGRLLGADQRQRHHQRAAALLARAAPTLSAFNERRTLLSSEQCHFICGVQQSDAQVTARTWARP